MGRLIWLAGRLARHLWGNKAVVPVEIPASTWCELTIACCDLAGFIPVVEKTKHATTPIANDYFGLMVPIIRRHRGYVDHFLGDGMMFFFGAPQPNPNHALDAVSAALEMNEAIRRMSEKPLGQVSLHIGIDTGYVAIGDIGADSAWHYTVVGEAVNSAKHLEEANKNAGTNILIGARTAECVQNRFRLRQIDDRTIIGPFKPIFEVLGAG